MNNSVFSRSWTLAGSLPGIPVYIEYRVAPSLETLRVQVIPPVPDAEPDADKCFTHSSTAQRYFEENFVQDLPEPRPPAPTMEERDTWTSEEHSDYTKRLRDQSLASIEAQSRRLIGDAYKVRDLFDAVRDSASLKHFLEVSGPFYETTGKHFVTMTDFLRWRAFFNEWRLSGKHPGEPPILTIGSENNQMILWDAASWEINDSSPSGKKVLTAYIASTTALEAIAATVIFDLMSSVKSRQCLYLGRGGRDPHLFPIGKHGDKQLFCDRICKEARRQQRRGPRAKTTPAISPTPMKRALRKRAE